MADYLNVVQRNDSDPSYSLASLVLLVYQNPDEATATGFHDVNFLDVSESHAADTDLVCRFTISLSAQNIQDQDFVGLYRIGWTSVNDFAVSQSMMTARGVMSSSQFGSGVIYTLIFKAETLPKDDGEFYQFCYISHSDPSTKHRNDPNNGETKTLENSGNCTGKLAHVKGASIPFQFIEDDFEILDHSSLTSFMMKNSDKLLDQCHDINKENYVELKNGDTVSIQDNKPNQSFNSSSISMVGDDQLISDQESLRREEINNKTDESLMTNEDTIYVHRKGEQKNLSLQLETSMKQVEELSDRLRYNESEKKALEQKLEEMKSLLLEKDKKISESGRTLDDKEAALESSRCRIEELEAAHHALVMAKENLSVRLSKRGKDCSKLIEQKKKATAERDQLKADLYEYKSLVEYQKNNEGTTNSLNTGEKLNDNCDLMFNNPYGSYQPDQQTRGHFYSEMNPF